MMMGRCVRRAGVLRGALAVMVGLIVFSLADEAAAATVCQVVHPGPDPGTFGTLPYCVDEVNQQNADEIEIVTAQTIEVDAPLVFEQSASIHAGGIRTITPSASFSGGSLFLVGTVCPGPSCIGPVSLSLSNVELAGASGVGGITVLDAHELSVTDSVIHDFGPALEGGCIWAGQKTSVSISESELYGCMALDGGALWSEALVTDIDSSHFHDNTADYNGGAIKIGSGNFFVRTLDVYKSTFEHNSGNWGGAVQASAYNVVVNVELVEFRGNVAKDRGGALHGKGDFTKCVFDRNHADLVGGALYLVDGTLLLDSTMVGNDAESGGAIAFDSTYGDLLVDGSTLAFNAAHSGDSGFGGALWVLDGQAMLLNSTLSENSAHSNHNNGTGGAIALRSAGKARIEHATIVENVADEVGGLFADVGSTTDLSSSYVVYSTGDDCDIQGAVVDTTSMDSDGSCNVPTGMPSIDPLANNGGPTMTRLAHGDGEDSAQCFATEDQRDVPRPAMDCDTGAVEQ